MYEYCVHCFAVTTSRWLRKSRPWTICVPGSLFNLYVLPVQSGEIIYIFVVDDFNNFFKLTEGGQQKAESGCQIDEKSFHKATQLPDNQKERKNSQIERISEFVLFQQCKNRSYCWSWKRTRCKESPKSTCLLTSRRRMNIVPVQFNTKSTHAVGCRE